ncbi:hypothetical protein MBLNU13_g05141t1 [Cladosporium sp. NU13]
MAIFSATNGGISDAVGSSVPTNSEIQREMPLRSAGDSSGVQHNAADNGSTHEEQHNELAISPVPLASDATNAVGSGTIDWTFAEQNPILSEEHTLLVGSILEGSSPIAEEHNGLPQASHVQPTGDGNGAADGSIPDFYSWNDEQCGNFNSAEGQYPPDDMLAASTTSSSTATLRPGSDVDDAPLDGASQQVGTVDVGSTIGLPVLSPREGWSMHDPSVQDFRRNYMDNGSSTNVGGIGTIDPRVLVKGADDSADMTAEATPADILAGAAQPAGNMDAGSGIDNNIIAPPAILGGSGQQPEQMDAENSVNNFGAPHAPLSGYEPPPMQMGVGNSANYPVATQATPTGFYVQPQMPMAAGNSTTNFAAQQLSVALATYNNFQGMQQQLNFAPNGYGQQQMGLNGSLQPFTAQLNTAPQAHGYPGAAQAVPPNGGMGQYGQPPVCLAGYDVASAMAYHQLGGLNSGAQPNMGQNWQATAPQPGMYGMSQQQLLPPFNGGALPYMGPNVPIAAPQFAAPVAAARTRRRQGDASAPRRPRRTVSATPAGGPTGPAANPVAAQQQVAAQEGPYTHTAAGAPNPDSTKKGNKQGQVKGWGQAFRHHKSRCDSFKLNGCVPGCQVRAKWPLTWADWTSRRFRVEWKTAQNGRPLIEDLSGFAMHAEGKEKSQARFVVLGEIQADGSVGKAESLHRLEVAAAPGPQSE